MGISKGIKRLCLDDIQLYWNPNTNRDDHLQNPISCLLAGSQKNGRISITIIGYYSMNPLDKLIRPFIFYGPIYYLFDIIIKVGSRKAFASACSMSFLSHHLITLLFLPFAVYSKHVPWFIIVFYTNISIYRVQDYVMLFCYVSNTIIYNIYIQWQFYYIIMVFCSHHSKSNKFIYNSMI